MVDAVRTAMDRAEQLTGQPKVHSFNVSAADYDTMLRRADYVASVMKPGSYAFLIDGITAGWMAVQTLRRHYPNVFIHFHRAGHGAFTRPENPIGYSVTVLTKFARLAGASGIHTGTAGVGKMAGNPEIDITAAKEGLRLMSEGPGFRQVWSRIPETDADIKEMIQFEDWKINQDMLVDIKDRSAEKLKYFLPKDNSRLMLKTVPIISGGLNPVLLPEFLDIMGTIDFITTMGGGVHSHPMGTKAGAMAVVQAYEAYKQNASLADYAKEYEELKVAIEFFDKNGTQAHRLHKLKGYEEV
jgi:ribulose-bisphosphate carboxylase large chain